MTNKPTALIVEDNLDLAESTRRFLEIKRFSVLISDGKNVKEIIEENKPDIIILDIFLGQFDGREICRRLKETKLTKNIPVVFLSANSRINEITEEYNARDFIAKPFEMDYLLSKIRQILAETTAET